MSEKTFDIALADQRPFFEIALQHGVRRAILTSAKLAAIEAEAPKGIVQIAEAFGSKYLRPEIETARKRIVNLVSLYLLETSQGDLDVAAKLLRDNTFLSLSRGGSGLLKALFALPEYAMLGKIEAKGRVEDFLDVWSLKEKPAEYRNALAHRQANAVEIAAAFWFGEQMGIPRAELQEDDADAQAVVRTAILAQMLGQSDMHALNQIAFAKLLDTARPKIKGGKRRKLETDMDMSAIPTQFQALATRVQQEIVQHDLPKIQDAAIPLAKLVHELKDRYFISDHDMEDTSEYDALVSKEWSKLTKGRVDIDSLITLFLCITAGSAPKTSWSERAAKIAVKKFRNEGFHPELAVAWIKQHAPHEKQEGLLEDWENFVEESQAYLLDDWDHTFSGALRFLDAHCHIEKPAKK